MHKYVVTQEEIEQFEGVQKTHFLNTNACRVNKSLGDMTGLVGIGFHLIEIAPGKDSTELHRHHHEEECVFILEGKAEATIGDEVVPVKAGDFIGYRAGGEAHKLHNHSDVPLRCIVVGQRLDHDVVDYPTQQKRLFRNRGLDWNLVPMADIEHPVAGKKT